MKHINYLLILFLLILFFITLCRCYQKDFYKQNNIIRENLGKYDTYKNARSASVVREVVIPRPTKYIIPITPDNPVENARSASVVREVVTPRPTKYIIPITPDNPLENARSGSVVREVVIPRVTPTRRS